VAADRWDRRPDGVEGLHEVLVLHSDLAVLGDQAQKGLDGVLQPVDRERGQRRRLSALLGRCGGLVADQRDPAGVGRGERHAEAPRGVGSTPAESRPAAALLLAAWRRLPISLPGVGAGHKTAVMAAAPPDLENVIHDLLADPVNAAEARTRAPATTGLYAWWAAPHVLPTLAGPPHPSIGNLRLLYVGIATSLRSRLASNHMRRSGSSTLRRTLAGLLLDDEQYRTRWTDRVVLIDDDETRLTDWMTKHLHVSWCAHPAPRDVEEAIIRGLRPPLNAEHASGPAVDLVKAARRRYYASAGARPGA
jgi:hypothetical protein